jgi:hypothetical protein
MKTCRIIITGLIFLLTMTCCSDNNSTDSDDKQTNNYITVGQDGGTFKIDENMFITIPKGALTSEIDFTVYRLGESDWQSVFDNYEENIITGLSAFSITPNTVQFNKPVKVHFKAVDSAPGIIPLVHTVDRSTGNHVMDSTVTWFDNENDTLSVAVLTGGDFVVEANSAWTLLAKKQSTLGCRDSLIIVKSGAKDIQCSDQDCQILESSVKVQFLSCPGQPIESAILRESSSSCQAVMQLSANSNNMNLNSSMPVKATVNIACMEIDNQTVSFSATGVGSISPNESNTDERGVAITTLNSGDDEGTVTVTAKAEVRYPVREIIINGLVEESFYRTDPVSESIDINVKNFPTWHIALDVELVNAPGSWGAYKDFVNYTAHVETNISIDTTLEIAIGYSDLSGTQHLGDITFENYFPEIQESVTLHKKNAPTLFPCRVKARYDNTSEIVNFIVTDQNENESENENFATWEVEITYKYDIQPPSILESFIGGFFADDGLGVEFQFPANENSYSDSGSMTTVTYDGTYNLAISKVSN